MSYWRKLSNGCRITLILMLLWFVFLIAIGHYNDAVFVLGLTPFIVGIVWARDAWRKRHPRAQHATGEEKRFAEAGRKIREAEDEYQARRAAKRQAKLKDAIMLGRSSVPMLPLPWTISIDTLAEAVPSPKSAARSRSTTQTTTISRSRVFRLWPTPSR
jgi:hypothetical protein